MLNLESIPEHIRAWVESDLLPEVEHLRTVGETLAQKGVTDAQRFLTLAQSVAAMGGPEAEAIVAEAQQALTDAQAFLQKVLSKTA